MRQKKATTKDIKAFEALQEWKMENKEVSIKALKTLPKDFFINVVVNIHGYPGFWSIVDDTWMNCKKEFEKYLKENGIKFRSPDTKTCRWNRDLNTRVVIYKIQANQLDDFLKLMSAEKDLEKFYLKKDFRGFGGSSLENPIHQWFGDVVKNSINRLECAVKSGVTYYNFARLDADFNYGNYRY